MSRTLKITSKRQVTFPREVCAELGLEPGDEVELVPDVRGGTRHWLLRKPEGHDRPWLGSLREFAGAASDHSLDAIRESIRRGRGEAREK